MTRRSRRRRSSPGRGTEFGRLLVVWLTQSAVVVEDEGMSKRTMVNRLKLGLLLTVAATFGCEPERAVNVPAEGVEPRRCVGEDEKFADDSLCERTDGGGGTGTWVADANRSDGGYRSYPRYHYVFVPLGYYGGVGSSAAGFMHATSPGSGHAAVRSGAVPLSASGSHAGSVSRGGFGARDRRCPLVLERSVSWSAWRSRRGWTGARRCRRRASRFTPCRDRTGTSQPPIASRTARSRASKPRRTRSID